MKTHENTTKLLELYFFNEVIFLFRNDKRKLIYFIIFVFSIFIMSELIIVFTVDYFENENTTELNRKAYAIENKIEKVFLNVNTLNDAYASFMKENPNASEEESIEFLEYLYSHQLNYTNNIAYLEDTTIKYNYPVEGNESSIGVDLMLIDTQKEYLQEAIDTRNSVFFGPVELVQGGIAFILFDPVIIDDTYIGTVATVLKQEELINLLDNESDIFDVSISLSEVSNKDPFLKSGISFIETPIIVSVDIEHSVWELAVYPNEASYTRLYIELITRLISLSIIGSVVYFMNSKHQYILNIEYKATHDFLTGNFNRSKFIEDYTNDEFHDSLIAFMDVNKFKVLNDTLGHQFGDWALIELSKTLRETNLFDVYRNSGDEFFLISKKKMSKEQFLDVTNKFEFSFYNEVLKQNIFVSLAVGFIPVIPNDLPLETMLMYLDYAMYDSKKLHRPYTIVNDELMKIYDEQKRMETMLIEDIKQNHFLNFYQPIIDVNTGKIYGVEVLSRWKYNNEILSAGRFINIVKKIRHIERVDQNLFDNLQKEYSFLKNQINDVEDIKFNINLSAELLKRFESDFKEFDKYITSLVIPKENIIFEISEDINLGIISNETIEYIKSKGFHLVIDDFGSGVSKLSDVLSGRLLAIKTDKSMLPESNKDTKKIKGFTTIVKAVHSTGSMVCVEGVETKEQLEIVKNVGCSIVQGYYFGQPLAVDEIADYINDFDINAY